MRLKTLLISAALAAAPLAVTASTSSLLTYTYDFKFTFQETGTNSSVNGFTNEGPGGDLTGFFTIDENKNVIDFDFEFQIIQPQTRFQPARTDDVDLDIDDNDLFGTTIFAAGGSVPERTVFGFSEINGLVQCSFRNASASPYSLNFQAFAFTPGDTDANFRVESKRSTPYCNQFGALQFGTTQSENQRQLSIDIDGSLRSLTPVPLPAGGWLLIAALGATALGRRRTTRA